MSERIPCGPATFRVTTEDHAERIASLLEPGPLTLQELLYCVNATGGYYRERMKDAVLSLVESGRVVERQAFTPRHPADRPLVWLELVGGAA